MKKLIALTPLVAVVIMLSGCVSSAPEEAPSQTSDASATPSPTATTPEFEAVDVPTEWPREIPIPTGKFSSVNYDADTESLMLVTRTDSKKDIDAWAKKMVAAGFTVVSGDASSENSDYTVRLESETQVAIAEVFSDVETEVLSGTYTVYTITPKAVLDDW